MASYPRSKFTCRYASFCSDNDGFNNYIYGKVSKTDREQFSHLFGANPLGVLNNFITTLVLFDRAINTPSEFVRRFELHAFAAEGEGAPETERLLMRFILSADYAAPTTAIHSQSTAFVECMAILRWKNGEENLPNIAIGSENEKDFPVPAELVDRKYMIDTLLEWKDRNFVNLEFSIMFDDE